MIRAYDETYLPGAMQNLGVMLDYAVTCCGTDPADYYARFLASRASAQFAAGHPRYLAGMSGIELALCVLEQTGRVPPGKPYYTEDRSPFFWAGWILAYIQWYFGLSFSSLAACGIDTDTLLGWYPTLHEADVSKTISLVTPMLEARMPSALKAIRKAAGFTQETLAQRSGVSLRMIRAYEQQTQPMEKAEYQTLAAIAQVLGCPVASILR